MRRSMTLLCALCALLALPAAASAQDNAAQDEYTENVPGAGGDRPSNESGGGSPGGSSLPPGTTEQLQALGADGAAAAALAEAAGPDRRDARGGSGAGQGPGSNLEAEGGSGGGGGGVGEVIEDFVVGSEDDGGIGIMLPLILGASLVAAIGFLLARRRGGTTAGPA